jgi:hypothetical protein
LTLLGQEDPWGYKRKSRKTTRSLCLPWATKDDQESEEGVEESKSQDNVASMGYTKVQKWQGLFALAPVYLHCRSLRKKPLSWKLFQISEEMLSGVVTSRPEGADIRGTAGLSGHRQCSADVFHHTEQQD